MTSLYDILKAKAIGAEAAEDMYISLMANTSGPLVDNPNPHRYIPIKLLSDYFGKDFKSEYWYCSLFYTGGFGDVATNFFYWKKSNNTNVSVEGGIATLISTEQDSYNHYNRSIADDDFQYDLGSDTAPYKFVFDRATMVATLYHQDGSVRWTSPVCVGVETNLLKR